MKDILTELLDKIFELEGLVTLSIKRTDIPDELKRLISKKGKDIAQACSSLSDILENDTTIEKSTPLPEDSLPKSPNQDIIEKTAWEVNDDFFISEYSLEEDDSQHSSTTAKSSEPWHDEIFQPVSGPKVRERGKLIFSINEKFRFRRELFDDSDIDFNNTLALVASMENYDEAEDYFINEEGFDMQNKVVKEFMEVIKRYFR